MGIIKSLLSALVKEKAAWDNNSITVEYNTKGIIGSTRATPKWVESRLGVLGEQELIRRLTWILKEVALRSHTEIVKYPHIIFTPYIDIQRKSSSEWTETMWAVDHDKGVIKVLPDGMMRPFITWAFVKWQIPDKYDELISTLDEELRYLWMNNGQENTDWSNR